MKTHRLLAAVALCVAVLSLVGTPYPLLPLAVILLAIALVLL